ncbi:MAG: hypothetical protein WKF79_13665, partial [Nocardioides sp.]
LAVRQRFPRIAEGAVGRARLSVVPRARQQTARVPFVTLVSLLLLTGVVGLLLFNTSMQQASFAQTALEEQATNMTARQQTLTMELDRLRDPQELARKARDAGMVPPPPPAFLNLDTGAVEGTPTAATEADDLQIEPPPPVLPAELDPDPITVPAPPPVQEIPGQVSTGGANAGPDTGRGNDRDGGREGRNGATQQSQQSQQSQQPLGRSEGR